MPAGLQRAHLMGCRDMGIGWKMQEPAVGHGWRSRVPEHASCCKRGRRRIIEGRKKHTKARERQRERIRMGAERSLLCRSVYRCTER